MIQNRNSNHLNSTQQHHQFSQIHQIQHFPFLKHTTSTPTSADTTNTQQQNRNEKTFLKKI